jgi:hypothetical protein
MSPLNGFTEDAQIVSAASLSNLILHEAVFSMASTRAQ